MKRLWILLGLFLCLTGMALADTVTGHVVPLETVSIEAPFGGPVEELTARVGMHLEAGDPLARIGLTRVPAPEDGTVTGLNVQPGDSAEQTVLFLAPVSKYSISCTISKAYESTENKYVELGEKVYIRCTADGSHKAVGIVTAINGSKYTVETTAGELFMEESVYIYRSNSYTSRTCIGSGKVGRTSVREIRGTGSVFRFTVEDGEEVERGQTLFETVDGAIDAYAPGDNTACTDVSGIIAEVLVRDGQKVAKGETLATLYPDGSYQMEAEVPQDLLYKAKVGNKVQIYMDWDEDKSHVIDGTITDVSFVGETKDTGETVYMCYIAFEAPGVRLGMNAHIQL